MSLPLTVESTFIYQSIFCYVKLLFTGFGLPWGYGRKKHLFSCATQWDQAPRPHTYEANLWAAQSWVTENTNFTFLVDI